MMDLHAYHQALNLGFSESEASRIGDDAWENNRHQPTCEPEPEPDYYDVLAAENTHLRAELERERMRLAACGVVAMANTPESAARARDIHPDYRSASCDDVARIVDSEMSLRAENADLLTDLDRVLTTLRYLIGIAERGEGRPMAEDETAELFVLGYVKRLEEGK